MSKCLLKCGKYNNNYKYLIFAIIFSFLRDFALGSANVITFEKLKAFDAGNISNCFLVRQTFCYLFTIIFSYLIYKIEDKNSGGNEIQTSSKALQLEFERKTTSDIEYIHNENEIEIYPTKNLLFLIFLWILEEEFLSYFGNIMIHLDFWMLELIVLHHFLIKYFNIEVFKHQKMMLWYCFLPFTLKVITILLSYMDDRNRNEEGETFKYSKDVNQKKLIYVAVWWIIFIGLAIYSIFIILRPYVTTKMKWLIDKKYISASRIFFLYGVVGFFFCLTVSIIATFINCGGNNEKDYSFQSYFCNVKYENNIYLDNILVYFSEFYFSDSIFDNEIIAISLGAIFFFGYKYCCVRIIEHLTPVHIILTFPFYYIINKSYLLVLNVIKTDNNQPYLKNLRYAREKLYLDFFGDFVSIFGYLVYLEIIELHFCEYDYNVRRNIFDRGDLDADLTDLEDLNNSLKNGSDIDGSKRSFSSTDTQKSINGRNDSFAEIDNN